MKWTSLGLAALLLASCYRTRTDDTTAQRLAAIEQRLDAHERAIAEATASTNPIELYALAQQLTMLKKELEAIREQVAVRPTRPKRREPDRRVTYSVPIGKSPAFGSPTAKVTLVMAMDFDCPYCRRAWGTVDELRKKYGKDLRVVYKPYVVHERTARLPAQAVCAAHKQGKWRELADLIWTKSFDVRDTDPDAFSTTRIIELAKQARLDMTRFEQDLVPCVDEVREEHESMKKLGVYATPSFFINGRYLAGAKPISEFSGLIDEEMKKATEAIKRGVKPERYYEEEIVGKGQPDLGP